MGKDGEHDPEVLELRIKSLEDWRDEQKETQSRIIWAFLAAAGLLIWEPIKRILSSGGGQ
jgi:hypothetical protein